MHASRLALLLGLFGYALFTTPCAWAAGKDKDKDKGKGKTEEKDKEGKADQGDKEKGKPAGTPKGPADRPPGWDQGKKTGWEDEYPPGWDKKSDEEKALWRKEVQEGKAEVKQAAAGKGADEAEQAKLQEAFERICRKGGEVPAVKSDVLEAVKKGQQAADVFKQHGITVEY